MQTPCMLSIGETHQMNVGYMSSVYLWTADTHSNEAVLLLPQSFIICRGMSEPQTEASSVRDMTSMTSFPLKWRRGSSFYTSSWILHIRFDCVAVALFSVQLNHSTQKIWVTTSHCLTNRDTHNTPKQQHFQTRNRLHSSCGLTRFSAAVHTELQWGKVHPWGEMPLIRLRAEEVHFP